MKMKKFALVFSLTLVAACCIGVGLAKISGTELSITESEGTDIESLAESAVFDTELGRQMTMSDLASEERSVAKFHTVNVSAPIEVVIVTGERKPIALRAERRVIKKLATEVRNGELNIFIDGRVKSHNLKSTVITISTTELRKISTSASADVKVTFGQDYVGESLEVRSSSSSEVSFNTFRGQSATLVATSSASIDGRVVGIEDLNVRVSSSGEVELTGNTKRLEATASSSGEADLSGCRSEQADAEATSSGELKIYATQQADVKANSSGSITYQGPRSLQSNERISSSGSIRRLDMIL